MTLLMILTLVAVVAVAATVHSLRHDGPRRPPRSHDVDPDFVAPSARLTS
ncbi:hypothetical protein [Nocardioides rubriscoriae]|nr:hypothetical protein [Nocardioides rubriscoriae]